MFKKGFAELTCFLARQVTLFYDRFCMPRGIVGIKNDLHLPESTTSNKMATIFLHLAQNIFKYLHI